MTRVLAAVTSVVALALLGPAAALAKKPADSEFHSSGAATQPAAVAGTGEPGTYEDFPFAIAGDDLVGTVTIVVSFLNPADDWDVYVYRKNSTGGLETVGSATSPPGQNSETVTITSQSTPVDPGNYVIRVVNYSAAVPSFDGTIKYKDYVIPNAKPIAKLKAPTRATTAKAVKLDGSGSRDSDGSIVNYAWDLNGDGSMETNGGTRKTLSRKLRAGVHHVTLRVTDNEGKRGYATRTIRVTKAKKKKRR
jgi:hypothetical protein